MVKKAHHLLIFIVNKPDTTELANKYNNYSGDGKNGDDQGLNARFLDKSSDYKK
jgi:hypothetical protein